MDQTFGGTERVFGQSHYNLHNGIRAPKGGMSAEDGPPRLLSLAASSRLCCIPCRRRNPDGTAYSDGVMGNHVWSLPLGPGELGAGEDP